MSGYFFKNIPLSQVTDTTSSSTSISGFSPVINYKTKTNDSGNNNIISLPYNSTNDVIPYNISIRANNGSTYWNSTAYYSSETQTTGTTNSDTVQNLNSFVNNTSFKYSKIRCILIGGSAGGSGGFASNSKLTGAGGGSGAYLSFDLTLDNSHPNSTLTLTAGGSGNGGQGANRSPGGAGGFGQLGGSGATSSLSYFSGANNQTSTFSANGGIRATSRTETSPGGSVVITANHTYNEIYSNAGKIGNAGSSGSTNGNGGNGPLVGTINLADSYTYGSDNVPTYSLPSPMPTSGPFPFNPWTNTTIANNADGANYGGKGGLGGPNYSTNAGYGGLGGTAGFARIYFFA